jgi:RNA polymerase sigma-70 factor (ECF subfamily)
LDAAQEARWLAQARAGRKEERDAACRELYEALRGPVWAVCARLGGDRALAEDAMQDAFLAVFRHLHRFRGEAKLATWVYRVAIREALAARARRPPRSEGLEAAEQLCAPGPTLDAQVAARERARAAQAGFRKLSAEHQTVLSLFAVEGLSHNQVAEVLGIPEGTVWYRLHAARKALKARMETQTP